MTLKEGGRRPSELKDELKDHVATKIGAIARPDDIIFAADLPKTRSGKIMRRLLKDIAEGRTLGDTTTLADASVVTRLKDEYAFFDEVTQAWRTIKGLAAGGGGVGSGDGGSGGLAGPTVGSALPARRLGWAGARSTPSPTARSAP